MSRAYAVDKVFNVDIPALHHGNDGLVYTCVTTPYTPATDENMYVCNTHISNVGSMNNHPQSQVETTFRKLYRL
jgi:hypothetical protein